MTRPIRADITSLEEEPKHIKIAIAKNPATRPSTLAELSHDPDRLVRYLVYMNPNTPEDVLEVLDDEEFEEGTYDLAIDCYVDDIEDFSDADLTLFKLKLKDIVETYGYTYIGCSWYDRMSESEYRDFAEAEGATFGDIAIDLDFSGLEDDDFTDDLRDAVLDYICGRPGFTYQSSDWV